MSLPGINPAAFTASQSPDTAPVIGTDGNGATQQNAQKNFTGLLLQQFRAAAGAQPGNPTPSNPPTLQGLPATTDADGSAESPAAQFLPAGGNSLPQGLPVLPTGVSAGDDATAELAVDETLFNNESGQGAPLLFQENQVRLADAVAQLQSAPGKGAGGLDEAQLANQQRLSAMSQALQMRELLPAGNIRTEMIVPLPTGDAQVLPDASSLPTTTISTAPVAAPPGNVIALPPMQRPLNHPGFDREMADRVQWMVGRQSQMAELRLNPPQLGPLEIRVNIQNDQANVTFVSQHVMVRDALEAAIPRLREMLADSGLQLGDTNVSQHSFAEQRERAESGAPANSWIGEGGDEHARGDPLSGAVGSFISAPGRIDFYA